MYNLYVVLETVLAISPIKLNRRQLLTVTDGSSNFLFYIPGVVRHKHMPQLIAYVNEVRKQQFGCVSLSTQLCLSATSVILQWLCLDSL